MQFDTKIAVVLRDDLAAWQMIERGIVPASGAPPTDSPEGAAPQQLMLETFVELSAR